jgi:DNA sulfur modification protein DndE
MKKLLLLPLLAFLVFFKMPDPPTRIYLIGDSTMANKPRLDLPERGWGQLFPEYFDSSVEIHNHAVNGRSTKSFRTLGHWSTVIGELQKNDWLFIQFGHNDSKLDDSTRYAAPHTDYRQNLIRYINEARARGAKPVLLTPVMRRKFDAQGKFVDQHGDYPGVVREIAAEMNVPLIDLHKSSQTLVEQHGVENSRELFLFKGNGFASTPEKLEDNTHFSEYGARCVASLVIDGIRALKLDFASHLLKSPFPEKLLYELPKSIEPTFRKETLNIANLGAKADGQTLNTAVINQAIERLSEAGGGTVVIPRGLWLTAPIVLKSNINLHLEAGAILQFSSNFDDFPLVEATFEGLKAIRNLSPISGTDLENVAITGAGVVDGGGMAWRAVKRGKVTPTFWQRLVASGGVTDEKGETWYPSEKSMKGNLMTGGISADKGMDFYKSIKDFLRPNMVLFTHCKKILIEGVTFQNSPAWTTHILLSQYFTVRGLKVKNPEFAQNSDAIDVESSRYGLIENNIFDTGDDGITLKSGRNEEGRKRGIATEDILIRNNTVYHAHGGIVIGSEMSGGVRNIFAHDNSFMGTDVGLRFKTARGRGNVVEQVYANNTNMTQIVGEAIIFDMYYMAKDPVPVAGESRELPEIKTEPLDEGTPQFKDFFIRNTTCKGANTGILVRGLPEMNIQNILIENAILESDQGLLAVEADNIRLKNVTFLTKDKTVMKVQNGKNITLDGIQFKPNADVLLQIMGTRSQNIRLLNTNSSQAKKEVELGQQVAPSVFSKR